MTCIDHLPKTTFAGRRFTRKQLRQVQETVASLPNLSRTELARTVCEHLDWRTSFLTNLDTAVAHVPHVLPQSRQAMTKGLYLTEPRFVP